MRQCPHCRAHYDGPICACIEESAKKYRDDERAKTVEKRRQNRKDRIGVKRRR